MWESFVDRFILNFISGDRWHYIVDGLGVTLEVSGGDHPFVTRQYGKV